MNTFLKYGEPPTREECKHLGVLKSPETIENTEESGLAGDMRVFNIYGTKLSPWARARFILRITRKKQLPISYDVPGLGLMLIGENGWEVIK